MRHKCDAAPWCQAEATPHTTVCRLHLKYPLHTPAESQDAWHRRMRQALEAAARKLAKTHKLQGQRRR